MFRLLKPIIVVICLSAMVNTSLAQTVIPANDASKYAGKVVSFLEMNYDVKYYPSSKTCLVSFPDPKTRDNSPIITIVYHNVVDKKRIHHLKSFKGRWLNITGRLLVNKGNFTINGNDPLTKISIYYGMMEVPEVPPTNSGPAAAADTTRHQ